MAQRPLAGLARQLTRRSTGTARRSAVRHEKGIPHLAVPVSAPKLEGSRGEILVEAQDVLALRRRHDGKTDGLRVGDRPGRQALEPPAPRLPVLITGGDEDPVGGSRGMTRLAEACARSGHEHVTLKLWPGGRHEMLNEINRDEFTEHLLQWIRDRSSGTR